MTEFPHIDVEQEMRTVVRRTGGTVLEDILPVPPTFENADFVFHQEKVLIELKCLTEDTISSPANEEKARNLWRRCHAKGLVADARQNDRDWRTLPRSVQNQFYEIRTRTIKKRLQKANRQVRVTKDQLGLQDYTGVVIMVNNGIRSLTPPAFIHATQLALQRDFREIRHFVFMTANLLTIVREVPHPALFWIPFDMQDGPTVGGGLMERLGSAWREHCQKITGIPGVEQELGDIEGFWHSRVLPG